MPRRNNGNEEAQCDLIVATLVFYFTFGQWNPKCGWLFNMHPFDSYCILMFARCCGEQALDAMHSEKSALCCVLGLLYPSLLIQTCIGVIAFSTADRETCRNKYTGMFLYYIMTALDFIFLFAHTLYLTCVVLPRCKELRYQRQQRERLREQLDLMEDIDEDARGNLTRLLQDYDERARRGTPLRRRRQVDRMVEYLEIHGNLQGFDPNRNLDWDEDSS